MLTKEKAAGPKFQDALHESSIENGVEQSNRTLADLRPSNADESSEVAAQGSKLKQILTIAGLVVVLGG